MTTRELAAACQVSEATVVRFVSQLGYEGYGEFLQALRDLVDTELTLLDRVDLSDMNGPGAERFRRVVFEEIDNLKELYAKIDMDAIDKVMDYLQRSSNIYVIGSRISYTFAYYMGWSLTKVRRGIRILKGSDSTTIDWLTIAPPDSFVVIIANSRYPNELIKVGKLVRRLGMTLLVIADSSLCPLIQFAHMTLIAPSQHFPLIGSPTPLSCLINYLVIELASRDGKELKEYQAKLEQSYRENDILFNLEEPDAVPNIP
jgi:DNA-binding MurR/RpiR family transcriptional regulator